jgi:hypothetical protein
VRTITIKKDNQSSKEMWQTMALYGFSSLNVGVLIAGGYFLGRLLERNLHWKNMSTIGLFVGLALGLYEIFSFAFKAGSKK